MQDTDIEASSRNEGKPSQEIYLEGRLKSKARLVGSVRDEDILGLLENCQGFQKLVHSIGVSVKTTDRYKGTVNFVLQNWGKTNKYETGTTLRVSIPTDGKEIILKTADYEWSADDDVPGKFAFEFENVGEMARASIKLYLNDDYYVPEMAVEPPVDFESDKYRDMIARSLMNRGNNKRLKNAIEKAESGDDVTIAYIGGSITQGAAAKPINTECYAYQSYLKFREMFGKGKGNNVHFIKAGVGGTSSELGMIRYERDILKDGKVEPDVVIVEFAVNDAGDETKGVCYESLVLKILSAENKPAVVLLFSVFENDWNLQDRLSPVGKHYNLPMVSVKDAVVEQFRLSKEEGNVISKRQYFYDIYHPTNDGHRVMADCLACLFSEIKGDKDDQDDIIIDKEPVIGNYYRNVRLLDRKDYPESVNIEMGSFQDKDRELQLVEMDIDSRGTPQFPYNWMYSVLENKSFKIEINSSSLILVFKDSGDSEFGKADVFVDGKKVLTADPHINNWTHCNTVILYQEEVSRDHQIEIKMTEGDEGKRFTILGFGYTR
ncbi:MAG: SGNH/GDSL hydrolase family protein [Halanaerobiales bacterium]